MKIQLVMIASLLLVLFSSPIQHATAQNIPLPDNFKALVPTSPKDPWVDLAVDQLTKGGSWGSDVLWYIPNRLLDLIDIFRVDVGVGPSVGGVVRITKYAQFGYREMLPASVRVGDLGRRIPVLIETSNEFGIGPAFVESADRAICPAEIGVGADVILAGAYGGVCLDEIVDFLGGIFFIDFKEDDY